jgi:4-hydroxythreonine-4-phosphate dehydrogenase
MSLFDSLPVIALSMGDPGGIGPELVAKACDDEVFSAARVLCFGDRAALCAGMELAQVSHSLPGYTGGAVPLGLSLVEVSHLAPDSRRWGRANQGAGRAQLDYFHAAISSVQRGESAALCTAPVTKALIDRETGHFTGHTGHLARVFSARAVMMLASEVLRVILVTEHIPLRRVSEALSVEDLRETIVITARGLSNDLGIHRPRLAVAALNPHAGEGGLLGDEESRVLAPAIEGARALLRDEAEIRDPLAADSLFTAKARASYDAAICLYHDQGLIPLKALSARSAVNVTLGLPIVRTSPDHGTAYDIAGQGIADAASLKRALLLAAEMSARRAGR